MDIRKLTLPALGLFAALAMASAQTIRVEAPNIVELQERFNVAFVIEGNDAPSDFRWSEGDGFTLVWGPQKGTSTSVQMVNGKVSRSSQTTYTYILQASKTGTFTLSPAVATIKGKEIRSDSMTIQVVGGGSSSGSPGSQAAQGSQQQGSSQSGSVSSSRNEADDIFMRLTLSRQEVVVGEPITATLKIYHRTNLVGFENARFPSFNGFWSQETVAPSNIEFKKEQVGDKIYNSAVLRQWVLIPQKVGTLSIDGAEIVCLVNVRTQRQRTGSIFDDFFENDYVTQRQRVVAGAPSVTVSPLPAGYPPTFGGGVGEFTVKASLTNDSIKAHDASSLIVTVSGKGNVSLLDTPEVKFPPDFDVYDTKSSTSTDKSGTSGSKTFEYPFIPRSAGEFTIGPVKYSFYNVRTHRYETAQSDTLRISVEKAPGTAGGGQDAGEGTTLTVDRKGVKNIGDDIRYIKTRTSLAPESGTFAGSALYWGLSGLLVLAAVAVWLLCRKAAARRADIAGTRNRKATKMALRRLRQADEFRSKGLVTAFYEELHKALLGFISDKLTMDMADQNKENIAAELVKGGVSEEVAAGFTALLDECEYARYAPSGEQGDMDSHYSRAVAAITEIDSSMGGLRKKPSASGTAVIAVLALTLLPFSSRAADNREDYPDSLFRAGVQAYASGDWASASSDWEGVLETGLRSKEVYYNLGNAYFKQGETGRAVLNYERALRLSPSDRDVRYNLDYARSMTQDRIDSVPEFFVATWIRGLRRSLGANAWAVLSLILLAATLALALLFLLGPSGTARKAGFFTGLTTLLLTVLCGTFALMGRSDMQRRDAAIVMKPVSSVKSSPSEDSSKDLFILHEGTRVRLLDQVSGYTEISLSDGRQGWIPSSDIEII